MKHKVEELIQREDQGEELSFVLFWGHTENPGKVIGLFPQYESACCALK